MQCNKKVKEGSNDFALEGEKFVSVKMWKPQVEQVFLGKV